MLIARCGALSSYPRRAELNTRPQAGEGETTARYDLARAGTSRVWMVTSRHEVCHVAFAQNVAITRSPSSKLTGIDVVVNRLCRDAQCVGSLGNRHAFVPLCSVECARHILPQRSTMPSRFRRVCWVLHLSQPSARAEGVGRPEPRSSRQSSVRRSRRGLPQRSRAPSRGSPPPHCTRELHHRHLA